MRWLMDVLTHWRHLEPPPEAPDPSLERDPELDVIHREQHDIMNRAAAHKIRDSWNEHVRRSWGQGGAR